MEQRFILFNNKWYSHTYEYISMSIWFILIGEWDVNVLIFGHQKNI